MGKLDNLLKILSIGAICTSVWLLVDVEKLLPITRKLDDFRLSLFEDFGLGTLSFLVAILALVWAWQQARSNKKKKKEEAQAARENEWIWPQDILKKFFMDPQKYEENKKKWSKEAQDKLKESQKYKTYIKEKEKGKYPPIVLTPEEENEVDVFEDDNNKFDQVSHEQEISKEKLH